MPPNLLQVLAITQNIISDHVLKKKLGGGNLGKSTRTRVQ